MLPDDELLYVLRLVADAADLARCRRACTAFKRQADDEALWEVHCDSAGLARNGSSRPTSRTYRSWRQTWLDARCVECGGTYTFKVNLDGGSCMATMWHGAKVALCRDCACAAVHCYRVNALRDVKECMPRLFAKYEPEGHQVARICGRNLESSVKPIDMVRWTSAMAKRVDTAKREAAARASGATSGSAT